MGEGFTVHEASAVATILFTDIEGSTRLWDQEPERMRPALASHDALVRGVIETHRGTVVKLTGDGVYAAFADPVDAITATLRMQLALADPAATNGVPLRVRCGLHTGTLEHHDNDYFGSEVNRGARIMSAAHGGQVILSQAVVDHMAGRLPAEVTLRDLGSVRLRDLSRPEHVYQVVHPKLRQDFPALRSLEATPNNLPQQVSSFVGREEVLRQVKTVFEATRLLTLLGVGGLGKTRLSLQVGADVMDEYPDGVWFVELAPLPDPRLVPQAVASALGVVEESGRPVQEALVKHVHDRKLLLILDNCEHLALAAAELAKALLQAGPQVKVLATSRESLHISGETTFSVPPLAVPPKHRPIALTALGEYESVRLFAERAVAAKPGFAMTEKNAQAIAEICRTLDGIPLALELAAARVRALPIEAIATRLSDRFRLPTGGDKTR
jgi:class 3 adenylate cyclase